MALSRADFVELIHEHAPALYRIAYRLVGDAHDAEDVVQETLRSAWKSRENFQCGRGQRAWLASILRRRVIDRWRRVGRKLVLVGDGPLDVWSPRWIRPQTVSRTKCSRHSPNFRTNSASPCCWSWSEN